ncbi:MAG: hypothetical protein DID90_2727552522 [Candidatus Nitrotoga sp. LAW]|nr:MAG: hypothetical protein DID90_2727552522 [Candidatus Nitrotoga sp. LAW]
MLKLNAMLPHLIVNGRSMRIIQGISKQIANLGLLLMMGVSMCACAATMSWKEEVLLHDGSKIIAERSYNLGGYPTIDSRERKSLDETITFTIPGANKKITWKMDFKDSEPEPNSLNLLVLDVVKGVPYIATYPAGIIAYNKWGSPNPPYVFFKHDGKMWQRISLEEFPAELNKTNVIVGRPPAELLKSFYTVEGVNAQNYDIHTEEYKTILRTPLEHWKPRPPGSNSGRMVRTGDGGWIGMDWFERQPSLEACLKKCAREEVNPQDCPCNTLFKGK